MQELKNRSSSHFLGKMSQQSCDSKVDRSEDATAIVARKKSALILIKNWYVLKHSRIQWVAWHEYKSFHNWKAFIYKSISKIWNPFIARSLKAVKAFTVLTERVHIEGKTEKTKFCPQCERSQHFTGSTCTCFSSLFTKCKFIKSFSRNKFGTNNDASTSSSSSQSTMAKSARFAGHLAWNWHYSNCLRW